MTNTIPNWQLADLGMPMPMCMPVARRVRTAYLRALPVTTGVMAADAAHKSVTTGAFPGASAWSPPS